MLRIKRNTQEQYVPLKQVNIDATIRSFAGNVTITQIFRNDESTPIEAVYCFPIEEQAAVYSFIARIDDREIIAQLKEKKEAQKEYNDALKYGHGAYLLEQDEKSQDCFIINVGALPAGKQCEIKISYVTELDLVNDGNKIRFIIPTTIAPRYNPNESKISSTIAGTRSQYVQSAPYTIEFNCQIDKLGQQVSQVSSPSHLINVNFSHDDFYQVSLSQQSTHLDRDIILNIHLNETRPNTILAVEKNAIMTVFTPNEEDCKKALGMGAGANQLLSTNEFIFVIDCSGSMQGDKIDAARQAMLLFLKSLPVNCRFNIIRFGSEYQSLFDKEITVIYSKKTMNKAQTMIKTMQADLGGTELLEPLQHLSSKPPLPGHSRQIFLLTDGEISNVNEVMYLCRSMSTSSRIFSFGLGHSPSRSLVKGLARTTNGRFVFISPNTSVDIYVAEQLTKALQPCITNVQVKWNQTCIQTAPKEVPPVYANDRLIFYGLLSNNNDSDDSQQFQHDTTINLYKSDNNILLGQAKVDRIPSIAQDQTLSRLAAKALIRELQHAKSEKQNKGSLQTRLQQQDEPSSAAAAANEKQQIIDLSLKYGILSPYTSFVAVEKRLNGDNSDMVLREVPIEITADDKHLFEKSQCQNLKSFSSYDREYELDDDLQQVSSMIGNLRNLACDMNYQIVNRNTQIERIRNDDRFDLCRVNMANKRATKLLLSGGASVNVNKSSKTSTQWPTLDQDIVRHLIDLQKFDGLWSLSDEQIQKLTEKRFSSYQSQYTNDLQIISSALVLITLEQQRFESYKTLWQVCVDKTKRRLTELLGGNNKLELFLQELREQQMLNHSEEQQIKTKKKTNNQNIFIRCFKRR